MFMAKNVKRLICMMLAMLILTMGMAMTASAATSASKAVNSSKMVTFNVTSGSGLSYTLGLKKTTVTATNTGKGTCAVYELNNAGLRYYRGELGAGQSKTFTISGSGKTSSLQFQRVYGNTTVCVTVSAGSVY